MNDTTDTLEGRLNLETARIEWTALQRFFAQGSVIWIDSSLDLIEIATAIAADDDAKIKRLMAADLVASVSNQQAKRWLAEDALLWSVVVRPLVLVQEPAA